jgi:hypothetical protein
MPAPFCVAGRPAPVAPPGPEQLKVFWFFFSKKNRFLSAYFCKPRVPGA